jgi:hypothetical protein
MEVLPMNAKQKEQQEAVRELREILKPGDTVYTNLKHVSRSGMSRVIMPFIIRDNSPRYIGWIVAKAIDERYNREKEGVVMGGCGMDMGFELVYRLSRVLFPDGFDTSFAGRRCPDHYEKHLDGGVMACPECGKGTRPDYYHNGPTDFVKDGGYALKHRWF